MGIRRFIKKYSEEIKQEKIRNEEIKRRREELGKTLDRIVNINLFEKEKPSLYESISKDVEFNDKKISNENSSGKIINKIHIEKMSASQLKNTYVCVKNSIKQAEKRNRLEEVEELKQLKIKVKKLLLEKSDNLDFTSIKYNIMFGDANKLDYYREYLLSCYTEYKDVKFNEEAQQMRITILTLLKLIELRKQKISNHQYVKKVA